MSFDPVDAPVTDGVDRQGYTHMFDREGEHARAEHIKHKANPCVIETHLKVSVHELTYLLSKTFMRHTHFTGEPAQ